MADKAFSAFDADVAFIREWNQRPVTELFQFIRRSNANSPLEYRDTIPAGANLFGVRVNGYNYKVRVVLSSVAAVALDFKQNDLDVLRCNLFKFNNDLFHFILLSSADSRVFPGSLSTKRHPPGTEAYRASYRFERQPRTIRRTVRGVF
jgi:hypothetical protein